MNMTSPNADASLERIPSLAYARLLTKTFSKSFYMATQFMSPSRKEDVYAVYAFCRYTDNIVDAPRSRSNDALKTELNEWRRELRAAYASGESRHPVLGMFVPVMRKHDIPLQLPLELIDGVEMDLFYDRYDRFAQLRNFCYHVASVVGLMMTYVFGYKDRAAFPYAEALGIAMQLTNILRDIDEDWRMRGKVYLPMEELAEYGVTVEQIAERRFDDAMRRFIRAQVERAHQYFEYADQGIPLLHREGQAAVRAASSLYREILREIERADYNIFTRRPVVSTRRKLAVLARMMLSFRLPGMKRMGSTAQSDNPSSMPPGEPTLPPVSSID